MKIKKERYYTEIGVEVTDRIKKFQTLFFEGNGFETENKAKEKAKRMNSYHYPVFADIGDDRTVVGYAVPR